MTRDVPPDSTKRYPLNIDMSTIPLTAEWADPYRAERIYKLLDGRNGLTRADLLAVQTDIYSCLLYTSCAAAWARKIGRGERGGGRDANGVDAGKTRCMKSTGTRVGGRYPRVRCRKQDEALRQIGLREELRRRSVDGAGCELPSGALADCLRRW